LAVDGKAIFEEVKVQISDQWPDYVFQNDYDLLSLKKTKEYIMENGHLPEIPSAAIADSEGIELGQMNIRLLKKIEELTLHLIRQEEEMNKLKERLDQVESN